MTEIFKITVILLECVICGSAFTRSNQNDSGKLLRLVQQYHRYKIDGYYSKRQFWETSNVGSLMYKNYVDQYYGAENTTFLILYWKYWWLLSYREQGGFDQCSVNNCVMTINDKDIQKADAVVVHVQYGHIPDVKLKRSSQRWIFMSDESPVNVFALAPQPQDLSRYANVFNWTMTYRSDSDIPIPYGRTIPVTKLSITEMPESVTTLIPNWKTKRKDVYVAAMISHCGVPERTSYINKLRKYINVDIYGRCHPNSLYCAGHSAHDCPLLNNYFFYLAFENSLCRQYITEKTFHNSYLKGNIPIIMGAAKDDCEKLLPPHSYLHVQNFRDPKHLAEYIKRIIMNEDNLLMFHQWRRFFEVVNEHGYFSSKSWHMCRVCEALNYNDKKPKVYNEDDLKLFFDRKLVCDSANKG